VRWLPLAEGFVRCTFRELHDLTSLPNFIWLTSGSAEPTLVSLTRSGSVLQSSPDEDRIRFRSG
jgi:hypothetical protein